MTLRRRDIDTVVPRRGDASGGSRAADVAGAAAAEPDDTALRPIIDDELAKIRLDVMKITGIAVESEVAVAEYIDSILPADAPGSAGATASIGTMIGGNVPEIAVGALALVSLFMVSMMVRRAAPAPPPLPAPVIEPPRAETIVAGEA
ncbi:MAG TPA: hypothetical protein PKB10_12640, partial [Tepidisphaeraceae bacterium]|nr:hypothetical protein [Tepidisphaeraceae bacterium]